MASTTVTLANVDTAYRPDLIAYLVGQGHNASTLQAMKPADVRQLAKDTLAGSATATPPIVSQTAASAPTTPTTPVAGIDLGTFGDILAASVAAKVQGNVMTALQTEFREALDQRPRELTLTIKADETVKSANLGLAHETLPRVARKVLADVPVYLYGPAGSGKTTVAGQLAKILAAHLGLESLPVHTCSFGPASQMHELTGIPPINGHAAGRTPLWDAWEFGGIILLDEMDAAPELLVQLNAGLGNGYIVFADGRRIDRHPHCRVIAAGNTICGGATMQYTSRVRQDKATINRFAFVEWGYDEKLELAIAGVDQTKWVKHVQAVRKAVVSLGASAPDILITPRASILGARELRTCPDTPWHELESDYLWQGCSADDQAKVTKALKGVR